MVNYHDSPNFNGKYGLVSRKIIRKLSEDSRISISGLSKELNLSRKTIDKRIKKLHEVLTIHYTLEFNLEKLGLANPHLILIKFGKEPDYDDITSILKKSHIPQLAVAIKGTFDMFIYAIAASDKEYAYWDNSMQILLAKYDAYWQASDIAHVNLGFFPLRKELVNRLNVEKPYKDILILLNENSKISFRDISKKIGLHFNTVNYYFKKLLRRGYIKKFTLTVEPTGDMVLVSYFSKLRAKGDIEDKSKVIRKMLMEDEERPLINRYIIHAQLIGSFGTFTLGVFNSYNEGYKQSVSRFKKTFKGDLHKIQYGHAVKTLIGKIPARSIDVVKTYDIINWSLNPMIYPKEL